MLNKMKNVSLFFTLVAAFFWLILSGCASTKVLTPEAIDGDINGLPYLHLCQFYLSDDVTLVFKSDDRTPVDLKKTDGTVEIQRSIIRRKIEIDDDTPGILRTKNKVGDKLDGYAFSVDSSGRQILILNILFDEDNDNIIQFRAYYNKNNDRFEIIGNEVDYGGLIYTITYDDDEPPYLLYKLKERTKEQSYSRKVKGRKVGS
jgi:hypothetical protein